MSKVKTILFLLMFYCTTYSYAQIQVMGDTMLGTEQNNIKNPNFKNDLLFPVKEILQQPNMINMINLEPKSAMQSSSFRSG